MKNFSNKVQIFLVYLYFILPHNYFNNDGWSAIKPHDIIACLIGISLFSKGSSKAPIYLILFSMWYLIRSLFAVSEIGIFALGYGCKFLEYVIIYYALNNLKINHLINLFKIIFYSIVFYMALELCGIKLGPSWGDRFSGPYGGPYELGAICMALLLLKSNNYFEKIVLFIAMLLSGAKASILAFVTAKIKIKSIKGVITIILILIIVILTSERLNELFDSIYKLVDFDFFLLFDSVPYTLTSEEYNNAWFLREDFSSKSGIDWSTASRLYTYILALKSMNYYQIIFGKGPGFFGIALDSSFLRVFGESGIVGFFLMYLMLRQLFIKIANKEITTAVIINMLFVDILFSARFLPLLFAIYIYVCNLNKIDVNSNN